VSPNEVAAISNKAIACSGGGFAWSIDRFMYGFADC
jgi:hypothetical protein